MNENTRTRSSNVALSSAGPYQSSVGSLPETGSVQESSELLPNAHSNNNPLEQVQGITQLDPQVITSDNGDTLETDGPSTAVQHRAPASSAPKKTIAIASEAMRDGTQLELIEDPQDSSRSLLAVFRNGEVHITDRFESESRIFVPIPRTTNFLRHMRLPRGVKPFRNVDSLMRNIEYILSRCLDLSDDCIGLLTLFVISTWLIERHRVAPYLALVGLPRSGKTTTLKILNWLCRRALLTADITSAAFYRVCQDFTPTLLIDETGTAADKKSLYHLLRNGTSRELTAFRKNQSFKTFGPKVISWLELPNDAALISRCIVIPLNETRRTDLLRITTPSVAELAENVQQQLLQFRFENCQSLAPAKFEGADQLPARSRDIYDALILPASDNVELCQWLVERLSVQEECFRPPLTVRQTVVLKCLFTHIHMASKKDAIYVGMLTSAANSILEFEEENFRLSAREVGSIVTSLGFTERRRLSRGWELRLDSVGVRRIHDLIAQYGNRPYHPLPEEPCCMDCEFCSGLPARWDSPYRSPRRYPAP